jgi:spectrin beta
MDATHIGNFEHVIYANLTSDIIDGNLKLILGLIWMLINRFQINTDPGGQKMSAKEAILNWVREYLKGYPIDLRDFPRW